MVAHKKERRYVQTEAEMHGILTESGLADAELEPFDPADHSPLARLSGDKLRDLWSISPPPWKPRLRAFGRRNVPLRSFVVHGARRDRPPAALPRPGPANPTRGSTRPEEFHVLQSGRRASGRGPGVDAGTRTPTTRPA